MGGGWERVVGLRKLSTVVASNNWWKGKREKEREKKTVQRKSQVAGVRAETERTEARRNRDRQRRREDKWGGGGWAKLEGFLCRSQWINEVKLMKSRRLEETSTPVFTFPPPPPYSLPTTPTLLLVLPPFPSLTPALPSHLLLFLAPSLSSHSLHTFCLSHHLFASLTRPSCLPQLTAGTVQISQGNCTTDRQRRGLCRHWRQHFTAAARVVRRCSVHVCKFAWLCEGKTINWTERVTCGWEELIEMDISSRTQLRGERHKHPTGGGKTNNTLFPISVCINAFSVLTTTRDNKFDPALPITAANLWEHHCGSPFYRSTARSPLVVSMVQALSVVFFFSCGKGSCVCVCHSLY